MSSMGDDRKFAKCSAGKLDCLGRLHGYVI